MMKSLSCVILLFVCNVIHSNCCLKKEERKLIDSVKLQLLKGCKEVKNSIDSSIEKVKDIKNDVKTKIDILDFTFKVVDDEYIKNSFSLGAKSDDKESKKSKNEKKLEEVISSFHSDYFFNKCDNLNFLIYVLIEDMFCNYGGYIIKVPILFLCKFEVSESVENVYDDDDKIKEISGKFFGDIFANKVVNKCYFFGKTNIIDVNMDYLDEGDGSESLPYTLGGYTTMQNLNLNKLNELNSKKNTISQAGVDTINYVPSSINNKFFVENNRFNNFSTTTKVIENKN